MEIRVRKIFIHLLWVALTSEDISCRQMKSKLEMKDRKWDPIYLTEDKINAFDLDKIIKMEIMALGNKMYGKPNKKSGKEVSSWTKDSKMNPEEMGEYLQGDILFTSNKGFGRNSLTDEKYRWHDAVIPYVISRRFSSEEREVIENAFEKYHSETCIRFVPRTKAERDYLFIGNRNTGCWSSVGRLGGRQKVNLQSPGCLMKIGTIVHELMHALGFLHEQNREDRDDFVEVIWKNIKSGKDANFKKAITGISDPLGESYDFHSVMHYSASAFSRNGHPTIKPKNGSYKMGQRNGLSSADVRKLKKMYNCS